MDKILSQNSVVWLMKRDVLIYLGGLKYLIFIIRLNIFSGSENSVNACYVHIPCLRKTTHSLAVTGEYKKPH